MFLQQLGRGLRWAPGKSVLTVLDFIGRAHADYRFDIRYRAVLGGTRRQTARAIEAGFPLLPAGCAMRLDRIAQDTVLENLRRNLAAARRHLVAELQALGPRTGLGEFLLETGVELEELYQRPAARHCFAALQRSAFPTVFRSAGWNGEAEKVPGRLLHVNDAERLDTWQRWLCLGEPPDVAALPARQERLAWMLFAALGQRRRPLTEIGAAFRELWQARGVKRELAELLGLLNEHVRARYEPLEEGGAVPLASHGAYGLYEIIAAYGLSGRGGMLRETREGVLWAEQARTDLLFVTLEKSEADYSPSTRYADYPLAPTLFRWESQSTTGADSPTGRRYIEHGQRGTKVVLFVRERKKDGRGETAPYLCLGEVRYVRHQSERPMKITWELARPMPAWLYQDSKVAAG